MRSEECQSLEARSPTKTAVPGRYLTYTDRQDPTDPELELAPSPHPCHESMSDIQASTDCRYRHSRCSRRAEARADSLSRPRCAHPNSAQIDRGSLQQVTQALDAWESIPGTGAVRTKPGRAGLHVARRPARRRGLPSRSRWCRAWRRTETGWAPVHLASTPGDAGGHLLTGEDLLAFAGSARCPRGD